MRIAISGASGFLGRQLVEKLEEGGHTVLAIGRDEFRLRALFPGRLVSTYADLASRAAGYDVLIHAAVANSDTELNDAQVFEANVELTVQVAEAARDAGIRRFLHLSSTHALDASNTSAYARNKRQSVERLKARTGPAVTIVYMPIVHGDRFAGKLALLNRFPSRLKSWLLGPLAALKPVVHIDRLVEFIVHIDASDFAGREVILSAPPPRIGWYSICKRVLDVSVSLAIILFFGWALALVWIAVRLQSKGPGIFAQERVGRGGKTFICYKFRTMKQGTVQAGTHDVSAASVTPLGRFLRSTKVDELPQVWNILRNEMSLVGPRPCLPVQRDVVAARQRYGVDVLTPGITGLAQINQVDMSTPETLARWDARYGSLRSLALDFQILVKTATGSGQGDRVGPHTNDH